MVSDSFSIRILNNNGKWTWSKNCIGFRTSFQDYYLARSVLNDIKYNHRIVALYNNTRNHYSEIHFNDQREVLHNEIFDFVR